MSYLLVIEYETLTPLVMMFESLEEARKKSKEINIFTRKTIYEKDLWTWNEVETVSSNKTKENE